MTKKLICSDARLANVLSEFRNYLNLSDVDTYSHYCVGSILDDFLTIMGEYDLDDEFVAMEGICHRMSHITDHCDHDAISCFIEFCEERNEPIVGVFEFVKSNGVYTINQISLASI